MTVPGDDGRAVRSIGCAMKPGSKPQFREQPDGATALARAPRAPSLETRLRQFDPSVRRQVRALVRKDPRVADLVAVFPGLLHEIVARGDDDPSARKALSLIETGAPLKTVAASLGWPMWMRRLPASAFHRRYGPIATSPQFARAIADRLPATQNRSRLWLDAVLFGLMSVDEAYALWLSERVDALQPGPHDDLSRTLRVLTMYAHASRTRDSNLRRFMLTIWHPEISTGRAICSAMSWLKRVELYVTLSDVDVKPWLANGTIGDYAFHHLGTAGELLREARAMQNCVDHYARDVRSGRCQLYSVRVRERRIATIEVAPHPKEQTTYAITQLKGIGNSRVARDVWSAAYLWLASQGERLTVQRRRGVRPACGEARWREVFGAAMDNDALAQIWPDTVAPATFDVLAMELKEVARRANVSSWQFR